jgi:hypothetical protein
MLLISGLFMMIWISVWENTKYKKRLDQKFIMELSRLKRNWEQEILESEVGISICKPENRMSGKDYVLQNFTDEESV